MSNTTSSSGWFPGKYAAAAMRRRKSTSGDERNDTSAKLPDANTATDTQVHSHSTHVTSTVVVGEVGNQPNRTIMESSVPTNHDFDSGQVQLLSTTSTRIGSIADSRDKSPPSPKGSLMIRVVKLSKNRTFCKPIIHAELEKKIITFPCPTSGSSDDRDRLTFNFDAVFRFNFNEISSDAIILVVDGDQKNKSIGKVAISLADFVAIPGKLKKKKIIASLYNLSDFETPTGKFRTGIVTVPESLRKKGKEPIGFLKMFIELELDEPLANCYMSPFNLLREDGRDYLFLNASPAANENQMAVYEIEDCIIRISRNFETPALLKPFMHFPEVLVLVALSGAIIFSVALWQIPLISFACLFLNGFLTSACRSFEHVIIWGNIAHSSKLSAYFPSEEKMKIETSPPHNLIALRNWLEKLVYFSETFWNLWNFSDTQVSIISLSAAFCISLLSSLLFSILSVRFSLFIITSLVLVSLSLYDLVLELLNSVITSNGEKSEPSILRDKSRQIFHALSGFIARVPNSRELEHRFIAKSAVVKELIGEIEDGQDFSDIE